MSRTRITLFDKLLDAWGQMPLQQKLDTLATLNALARTEIRLAAQTKKTETDQLTLKGDDAK